MSTALSTEPWRELVVFAHRDLPPGPQISRIRAEKGGFLELVYDSAAAADSAPMAVFGNAGQDCCARSRILVERSALDRFMDALESEVEAPAATGEETAEAALRLLNAIESLLSDRVLTYATR